VWDLRNATDRLCRHWPANAHAEQETERVNKDGASNILLAAKSMALELRSKKSTLDL
jgi:predicted transposase YbfD/YdcC